MRYRINFDKTINQLVPYYLGGRRLILFLQSCIKPLQSTNEDFEDYAKETRIEAAMTSQIFKLEWFLNRKFKKYFCNPDDLIVIKNGEKLGVPVFNQLASDINDNDQFKLWEMTEIKDGEKTTTLYYSDEKTIGSSHSFLVCVPALNLKKDDKGILTDQLVVDGITIAQFTAMVRHWVDKYRISSKTYNVIINTDISK